MKFADFKTELENLNYRCFKEKDVVHIYDENCDYFGTMQWNSHAGQAYYNGKSCKNAEELIDKIAKYNSTLKYPAFYYDELIKEQYKASRVIKNYMLSKGFKHDFEAGYSYVCDRYCLIGAYDRKIFECEIVWGEDDTICNGSVKRFISGNSWIDCGSFDDIDTCIAKLNSLITFELMVNAVQEVCAAEKLEKTMDFSEIKKNDIDTQFNIVTTDYKAKMKEMLENALKELNKNI